MLPKRGTPLEDLPEATMMQKSDFIPAIERGVAQGGVVGLLAGLVGIALAPGAMVIAGGIMIHRGEAPTMLGLLGALTPSSSTVPRWPQ